MRVLACVVPALAIAALTGCGKTSTDSSGSAANTTSTAAKATDCGTTASLPFKDASGVIDKLGPDYQKAYDGYADPIFPSAWANFKPKHKGPYVVGVSITQPINDFQTALARELKKSLEAVDGVGEVKLLTSPPTALTTELQQTTQLIQEKVDIIVSEPLVPPAFVDVAAQAAKAGIPVISVINAIPSPNAITVGPNSVADGQTLGAEVAKFAGGTGTVIGVHGITSTGSDKAAFKGFSTAFAKCPDIKFDTSIVGAFQPPVAKQQTLTFLSSHPQKVAGAVQTAGMTSGLMQAFEQTGRPQPAQGNSAPVAGDLAYWAANKGSYKSVATAIGPQDIGRAVAFTATQLLAGKGPKVSVITQPSVVIDESNLDQFVVPGAKPTSQATVETNGQWLSDSFLAPLFGE
jgi:ribose transport system substrate-binding protein